MHILIINGPNLNLLGEREPSVYGNIDFDNYYKLLKEKFSEVNLSFFQSNIEGHIIDKIHEYRGTADGIIINGGGYSHTSVSIRDAIAAIAIPVVEVHISNIYNRENFRKELILAPKCIGTISGFGLFSYDLAIISLLEIKKN